MIPLYRYSGAGNVFVVLDGRGIDLAPFRDLARISRLCHSHHTDGLMILREGQPATDFTMEFFNPDGSGGMMCGNGGRCIVAFADFLGIRPADGEIYRFEAGDGLHTGQILAHPSERRWTVRIKMIDVEGMTPMLGGYFIQTGTRHFVRFVEDLDGLDVETEGKALRWHPAFAPEGSNINFVRVRENGLQIRTFEKGVEGETLACGTGITAAALVAYGSGCLSAREIPVAARIADLKVDFDPLPSGAFRDVYLTGPAEWERLIEWV